MKNDYALKNFPPPDRIMEFFTRKTLPAYRPVNGHIHTPFSFSAFGSVDAVFTAAREENISVLGINDFYVTDGYDDFYRGCLKNGIFPLFNIEFIGLIKNFQEAGIRVNDPNNPGRIYFCGKGLDYPFHLESGLKAELDAVKEKTQEQLRKMVGKLNLLISKAGPGLSLQFDEIRSRFAKGLVRERHLAKAVRVLAEENFRNPEERTAFIETLYGGKKSKVSTGSPAALENEIRANLLKAGGAAFVEEDESTFLQPLKIRQIIADAGGIPCYPVLLDDSSGNFTEFEGDFPKLAEELERMQTNIIELIPGRNDKKILEKFTEFFYDAGFTVTFGTEHNTPEMEPLTVKARGKADLSGNLKEITWKGACVIAAHQYLRAMGETGFVSSDKPDIVQRSRFEELGKNVIEYYLKEYYENRT